jgi:hypothetical protein
MPRSRARVVDMFRAMARISVMFRFRVGFVLQLI